MFMQKIRHATTKHRTVLIVVVALLAVGLVGSFAVWGAADSPSTTNTDNMSTMEQIELYESYIAQTLPAEGEQITYDTAGSLAGLYMTLYSLYANAYNETVVEDADLGQEYYDKSIDAAAKAAEYYQLQLDNAAEDVVVDQDEETITPSEVGGEQKGGENTSSKEKEMDLPYTAKVGQEVTNIAAVNASIDAMPITRGLSDDEVKKVLKALVKSYSPGITDVTYTKKVTVPAYTIVTLKTTTEYETSDNTISTVVDGKLYTIPNVKIKKVVKTVVDPVFTSTEHGHGHGHGNGNNAGGGDGAAE